MLLVTEDGNSALRLVNFTYGADNIGYVQYNEGVTIAPRTITNEQFGSVFSSIIVPQHKEGGNKSSKFVPAKMEVLPTCSGRSNMPARVCLLGKDGETYKVFTIPKGWLNEETNKSS